MQKVVVVAFFLYTLVFSYLSKSSQTIGFIVFIFLSVCFVLINRKKIPLRFSRDTEIKRFLKIFKFFLIVSSFYLAISFLNLPKLWKIDELMFDMTYIPRHFFIIAELFIPILIGYALFRLHIFNKLKVSVLIALYFLIFLTNLNNCVYSLLLILLSLVAWKMNCKMIMFLAFFINYHQTTYILGFVTMMFLLFFEKSISLFLSKNTITKITSFVCLAIVVIFLLSNFLMFYVKNDPNSIWRYYVWMNEMDSLIKTYFSGVGFGSAYISNDIIYQVDNINMYYNNVEGSFETGAFIIANHSSIINMFYRMGIIGGLLFISLYVQIIRIVCKLYNQADIIKRRLLWYVFSVWIYETVVIFLNPGLEMMQFALSYLLSLSVLTAVILEILFRKVFDEKLKLYNLKKLRDYDDKSY